MQRQSYRFEGVVTALSSISHIGDSFGNESLLRREKVIQPDGRVEQVPIFSGNAMRGLLRDLGMSYMLERIGSPKLSLAAFYFLFSGGSLTKNGSKTIDIDRARTLKELIPLVGIFGGAVGNQIMPGRAQIGKLVPVCAETAHILPPQAVNGTNESIWEYLQREAYSRKDDAKDDRRRGALQEGERLLLDTRAASKRAVAKTDKDVDHEAGQHAQMRYHCETFAAGTRFWWELSLLDVDDIEFESFVSCLIQLARNPVIGGKGAVGHGRISIQFDKWLTIDPRISTGTEVDKPLGKKYEEHLTGRAADILGLLNEFE